MKKNWFLKGIFLGLAFYISMIVQKPIGVSTQFSVATGVIEKVFDSTLIYKTIDNKTGYGSTNPYYNSSGGSIAKEIANPINYDMAFILGIMLGAGVLSMVYPKDREDNLRTSEREGNSVKVYAKLFLGGFLVIYGGRLAGGCTSGHMMSGISQMSLSSFIFTIVLFPIAIFIAKKWGE